MNAWTKDLAKITRKNYQLVLLAMKFQPILLLSLPKTNVVAQFTAT